MTDTISPTTRFWARVDKTDSCWLWTASLDTGGCGLFRLDGKLVKAHRYSWELTNGPIPKDHFVMATCGNKACVNPDHLICRSQAEYIFWKNATPQVDGCWVWSGARFTARGGYGRIVIENKPIGAHRYSYMMFNDVTYLSRDDVICHTCDNPPCVNPDHLFLGTDAINSDDKVTKGRQAKGGQLPQTKLTVEDVLAIRQQVSDGISQTDLCVKYNMSSASISRIVNRKVWKHV